MVMRKEVDITTAHVAVGALVLAGSVFLSVRTFQLYRVPGGAVVEGPALEPPVGTFALAEEMHTNGRDDHGSEKTSAGQGSAN